MAGEFLLRPLPAREFGYLQAQHLLSRAAFGGTPEQVRALADMGLTRAVDFLVDFQKIDGGGLPEPKIDPDILKPPTAEERQLVRQARGQDVDKALRDKLRALRLQREAQDRQQLGTLQRWWLARMIATPRPLEEKLTLLWHGHFASQHRKVRDSFLMHRQNQLFRGHAAGNFAQLALGVVRDPAMLRFLDNVQNNKARPNENLAREFMELFTLGVGNYTEADIKEGARALTGYGVEDDNFIFRGRQHDHGPKTILGRTGNFDGDDFVRILLARKDCPLFVAYKLYKGFVSDLVPGAAGFSALDKAAITQLAAALEGSRYELRPVLKVLFASAHFYDPQFAGNMIKTPAQLAVGTVRVLGTPTREVSVLADAMGVMGQELYEPPSVAGWPGGRTWINTSTLYARQNLCAYLITGKLPYDNHWTRGTIEFDPMPLVENIDTKSPQAVVSHLMDTTLGRQTLPQRKAQLVAFLKERKDGVNQDSLIALLLLITALPEYQLC